MRKDIGRRKKQPFKNCVEALPLYVVTFTLDFLELKEENTIF